MSRTGSYPLMDLAREFGVDYGDVLLAADWFRRLYCEPHMTRERDEEAGLAFSRLNRSIQYGMRFFSLKNAIAFHARRRWL